MSSLPGAREFLDAMDPEGMYERRMEELGDMIWHPHMPHGMCMQPPHAEHDHDNIACIGSTTFGQLLNCVAQADSES